TLLVFVTALLLAACQQTDIKKQPQTHDNIELITLPDGTECLKFYDPYRNGMDQYTCNWRR
ncbi:MAG: hypothetical protein OXE99_06050, partial [Cellvibrionales bacterium]|nr:hypothetical protein [Cellvibrionales bacterium]